MNLSSGSRGKIIVKMTNDHGVTLIELLVYMVITGMLLATAVVAFMGQNSSYNKQDVVAEMQQNLRGAKESISVDIRFAGIGLEDNTTGIDPFVSAGPQQLSVNYWDENLSPPAVKTAAYSYAPATLELSRDDGVIAGVIAENIEELLFQYLVPNASGTALIWDDNPANLADIRAVKIHMLAAARSSAFNPTDTIQYHPPVDDPPVNPPTVEWLPAAGSGYKQMASYIIQCRNNLELN